MAVAPMAPWAQLVGWGGKPRAAQDPSDTMTMPQVTSQMTSAADLQDRVGPVRRGLLRVHQPVLVGRGLHLVEPSQDGVQLRLVGREVEDRLPEGAVHLIGHRVRGVEAEDLGIGEELRLLLEVRVGVVLEQEVPGEGATGGDEDGLCLGAHEIGDELPSAGRVPQQGHEVAGPDDGPAEARVDVGEAA